MNSMAPSTYFSPQLFIRNGVTDVSFYTRALDAVEQQRWTNDDGTIHVVEMAVGPLLFHLHEAMQKKKHLEPQSMDGATTVQLGLFVPDVATAMKKAIAAGATEINPVTDYEYGYRQAEFRDPFGHVWALQQKI